MPPPSSSHKRSSQNSNIQGIAADERKLKRKLANKEWSRRSRQNKQQELVVLLEDRRRLEAENALAAAQIAAYMADLAKAEAEYAVLRAQHGELAGKLEGLEDVLEMLQVPGPAPAVDTIPAEIPVEYPPLCTCQSTFAQQLAAASAMAEDFPF